MPHRSLAATLLGLLFAVTALARGADALPSWNDGPAQARAFVQAMTQPGNKDFVAREDRVAVFDNDVRLWSEQPRASSPPLRSPVPGP
jgi:hypothetical protein